MEIWKHIAGYEGLYWVSNLGRVKNAEKVLKLTPNKKGYQRVGLHKNGKIKTVYVHRLVAEAFVPNNNNLPQVNHKDENKSNNNADNLEWCTSLYNNTYGDKNERANETKRQRGLCSNLNSKKRIKEIFEEMAISSTYDSETICKYRIELHSLLRKHP